MKKFIVILAIGLSAAGCSSFGVWSTTAQSDITAFTAWADQWIGGALAAAPAIIAAASAIPGVPAQDISAANSALAAAKGTMTTLDAMGGAASANTTAATMAAVVDSINQVSSTIGAVQATIAAAKQ